MTLPRQSWHDSSKEKIKEEKRFFFHTWMLSKIYSLNGPMSFLLQMLQFWCTVSFYALEVAISEIKV